MIFKNRWFFLFVFLLFTLNYKRGFLYALQQQSTKELNPDRNDPLRFLQTSFVWGGDDSVVICVSMIVSIPPGPFLEAFLISKSLPSTEMWRSRRTIQRPSAFHSPWKAWVEWLQSSLQRKDGEHFYNHGNNESPGQRSADVSLHPNEALDCCTHIKRPLWISPTRVYLLLSF